jgi:serine/threonine protein kinase
VLQLCDAVGDAHAQGIVHRDIKPENVMLVKPRRRPDYVKVLDFGIARIDWRTVGRHAGGAIFGTARYISPEGAQGKVATAESDVYSLAVLLFESLSGTTPFEAESPVAILIKHTSEPAPDVRSVPRAAYVPDAIARVIADNLRKDPRARARNAFELAQQLRRAISECGLSLLSSGDGRALPLPSIERTRALPVGADAPAPAASRPAAAPEASAETELPVAPSKRWLLAAVVLGAMLVLLAIGGRFL